MARVLEVAERLTPKVAAMAPPLPAVALAVLESKRMLFH